MIIIEFTKQTIKALDRKLKIALKFNNPKLIKKVASLCMLSKGVPSDLICQVWDITERTLYNWRNDFLAKRMKSLFIKRRKGNRAKLSDKQKQALKTIILQGPQKAGFDRGTWTSQMVRELIKTKYKVTYNRRYVCSILKQLGLSYQKGKFIPDKDVSEARKLWKDNTWPALLEKAKRENAVILFQDEASFALWGSLSYTWGLKGQQPLVKTTGKRKKLKAFGVIDYFSGRFIFETVEGKLNSSSYIIFLKRVLRSFSKKIILVHDSAPYHKSQAVKTFVEQEQRLETEPLPSYSPEFNIIEYLWKKVKSRIHNIYCDNFEALKKHVRKSLRYFQKRRSEVLILCNSYINMMIKYAL